MINQINQPFTTYQTEDTQTSHIKFWAIGAGLILTILASFIWSGLVLVGIGSLCFSFSLIALSLINQHLHAETNWGTVLVGQLIAICGMALLLVAYFL